MYVCTYIFEFILFYKIYFPQVLVLTVVTAVNGRPLSASTRLTDVFMMVNGHPLTKSSFERPLCPLSEGIR